MDRTPFAVLQRDATGYQRSCALTAAAELDFFTVILRNGNRMNAGDLARECGVDERGAAVLLNALAGMGYLCKSMGGASADPDQGGPGVYAVAEAYRDALDSRHPLSYVPMLRHMANAQRGWAELAGGAAKCMQSALANLSAYDVILNTAPVLLLDREVLQTVREDALVIDLASRPGGVDFAAAEALGKQVVWALSLPPSGTG